MSFSKTTVQQVTKTLPDGTVIGVESVEVSIQYMVKSVQVTATSTDADLHYSYDDGLSWQMMGKYPVTLDLTQGVPLLEQAEEQIKNLEAFSTK